MRLPSKAAWAHEFWEARGYFYGLIPMCVSSQILPEPFAVSLQSAAYLIVGIVGGTAMRVLYPRTPSRIYATPGHRLLRIVEFLYSPSTVTRVLLPAIRDMQHEHLDALSHGQPWKARWVLVRGRWSVLSAVMAQAPLSLLKRLVELWKAAG